MFAVSPVLEGLLVLVAAGAGAAVLALPDARRRTRLMPVALVVAALAVGVSASDSLVDDLEGRWPLVGITVGAGMVVLGLLVLAIRRRPGVLVALAVAALPFRIPVPIGPDETANLLLPLYAVIAAGVLARLVGEVPAAAARPQAVARRVRRLEVALAVVIGLYAVQALYSSDLSHALRNVCFFYVPFAVLLRLLLDTAWTRRTVVAAFAVTVGLALLFAAVGLWSYATKQLILPNDKVLAANELQAYFRVNSLFFDPNIYGRYLALTMTVLAVVLLWTRSARDVALAAAALALLWGGLLLSLSQSSFAALAAGLAVVAALRWSPRLIGGLVAAAAVVAAAVLLAAPGAVGVDVDSDRALNQVTSGRATLLRSGVEMFQERPVWGYGSGSFAERYRRRERVFEPRRAAESHTIPVTVAAEQGVVGLLAYGWLLFAAGRLLFAGVLAGVRQEAPSVQAVGRAAVAAAFCGLFVHTLVYAAFLEDPLTWTLLAASGAMATVRAGASRAG